MTSPNLSVRARDRESAHAGVSADGSRGDSGCADTGPGHGLTERCRLDRPQSAAGSLAAPGRLFPERGSLRAPDPSEVVVHNALTRLDPYQLPMLCESPEVAHVAVSEPVPATPRGSLCNRGGSNVEAVWPVNAAHDCLEAA